jgi:DNA-binding NarL/FixJ family response regulator
MDGAAEVAVLCDVPEIRARIEAVLTAASLVIGRRGACVVAFVDLAADPDRLAAIRDEHPEGILVVCSPPAGARGVRKAVDGGADGLVWEARLETTLLPTIRAVLSGQVAVPREVWRRVERPELTNREKQTLALVVMGLSNGEIAQRLFVSESTVKSHLSAAFRKLGVSSRAEAARVISDPKEGLGTGILAITSTSSSGRAHSGPR